MRVASLMLIVFFCLPSFESSEEPGFLQRLVRNSIIKVGISFRSDELTIKDDALGGEGKLVDEHEPGPSISLGFENSYFGDSNWGYTAVFGYARFKLDEQKIGSDSDDIVDLGTSAKGELFYIAPSIFYMFGAKHYDGGYLKVGMALGIGYLTTEGDVLLTDVAGTPRHSFDISSDPLSASVGFFLETGYEDWFFRFQVAGPVIEEDDREISGATVSVTLGYTFHLFN